MRRTRWARWTRAVTAALSLGVLSVLLTGCSASDWERDLRFGWPTGVTRQGTRMRVLWTWAGVAALVLGVIVWGLIFWACLRYRKRKDDDGSIPRQTKYNLVIELICVTVPLLVVVGLFYRTVVVQDYVTKLSANPDVVVRVDAFKWNWEFEYLSHRTSSGQNVETSYAGTTDVTTGAGSKQPVYYNTVGTSTEIPVLVIPVGESVQFVEHSEDVIHGFWVPEFLFKRDVIPYGTQEQQRASGLTDNRFQINATTTGSYVGRCSELCGTYHSQMNFEVRVVQPDVFQRYLDALKALGPTNPARQHLALQQAGVPGGPYATTTHPFETSRTATSAVDDSGS